RRVAPGEPFAADEQEGLDREATGERLDRAVLADQRGVGRALASHDGPVTLLAREAAREDPARSPLRERAEEIVARIPDGERLDADLGEREPVRGCFGSDPHEAGFAV